MIFFAALVHQFLNWLAPIRIDVLADNDLADLESHIETLEPDELWAAMARHRLPAGTQPLPNQPPRGWAHAAHPPGAGGLFLHAAELRKSR